MFSFLNEIDEPELQRIWVEPNWEIPLLYVELVSSIVTLHVLWMVGIYNWWKHLAYNKKGHMSSLGLISQFGPTVDVEEKLGQLEFQSII